MEINETQTPGATSQETVVNQEQTTTGATSQEQVVTQSQTFKIGGVEVDSTNPETIVKAQEAYANSVKAMNAAQQEAAKLRNQTQTTSQEQTTQPKSDDRVEALYKRAIKQDFNNLAKAEQARLSEKYGEAYKIAEGDFNKAISELPENLIDGALKAGNLENVFKITSANALLAQFTKQGAVVSNPTIQQAAVSDPNVQKQVIANQLNGIAQQESLPPSMPNGGVATMFNTQQAQEPQTIEEVRAFRKAKAAK